MKTIAVIPAHNEEKHISEVVYETKKHVDEVIVIDDYSKDQTSVLAKKAGAIVIRHRVNLGKAGGLKTGCELAFQLGGEVIIFLDGDGQHNPAKIPVFLEEIQKGAQIVFGVREDISSMPFTRKLGTKALEIMMSTLYGLHITDTQCGYRAFRADIFPLIKWKSKNYHADAEITARVGKKKLRYKTIPIETIYHDAYKGMTVTDGMGLLFKLFIWRFTL